MNSQDFRNLQEAYLDVYENEQLDEMPYRVVTKNDGGEEVYVGGKYATRKTARTKVDKEDEKVGGYRHSIRKVDEAKDIFNYVMEYLISEGYVDTLQGAEQIISVMSEEWIHTIVEKFSMAADPSKPQSPKRTKLPRSREEKIGPHDDWKDKPTEWGELPPAAKKLRSRAITVTGTQKRQDIETGVR